MGDSSVGGPRDGPGPGSDSGPEPKLDSELHGNGTREHAMNALVSQAASAVLVVLVMLGRIFGGVALFARGLELREHFGARCAAFIALCVLSYLGFLGLALATLGRIGAGAGYIIQLLVFSLILVVCVVMLMFFCNTSVWVALFCVTAGYSMQNLCSGASELLNVLGDWAGLAASSYSSPWYWLNTLVPIAVVFPLCYLLVVRKIDAEGLRRIEDRSMLLMMPVVSLVVIGFDLTVKAMTAGGLGIVYVLVLRIMHGLACIFILWMEYELLYRRHLAQEMATTERLMEERTRQYERSRENIEAINIKCHDIKHQIRTLAAGGGAADPQALAELEREVEIYDTTVTTGNDALDTILTEKSLMCERSGIALTCVADGGALDFMAPADLYALFGNALDNAIEAVSQLPEERRSITLSVRRALGGVSIHVENPCVPGVRFEGGLPQTTKPDRANHGFGSRSMRGIAARYGGTYVAEEEAGTFHLNILLPLP